ncbi:p74 [Sucra jujuba nucleopolyhedrovirus]|uniref:p74 n=1 Tax=Sucra jujuba nucleopolyhedrovirus TaxID=1563660 RepID=A0A097P8X8_9ABAC|nr:p74 [Sucra jujuba nucleopolyhedrovirus]AIU41254.1 p74 [Sucra jujuba nucleopolyhedrovirus]
MATLTTTDLTNASRYAVHRHRLNFIPKWRARFPNILIDYEIRPATNDDYYVPPLLKDVAVAVKLTFSKRGCESMSCYPFTETEPIDYSTKFGYTQTSETAVGYAQPACYHLDRAAATRTGAENEVQAPELRYTTANGCILADTLSKMYFNSPYLRTEEHLISGVDDVPGFNVHPNADPLFPEMFRGEFNQAYCRRFGRTLTNGGCSMQWWESVIGFVLGDTIYTTFKLAANNIFSELRNFDYTRPSPDLPAKPTADADLLLANWLAVRDPKVDVTYESKFSDFAQLVELNIDERTRIKYTAELGFEKLPFSRELHYRSRNNTLPVAASNFNVNEDDLKFIISQFMEDYSLLIGLWVSSGFDNVIDAMKYMLRKINASLIPAMKRVLLNTSKRITVKLLGESYKAAVVHQFNRIAIKSISAAAKAMSKIAIQAASVVGVILILLTLADLVLAFWDPFGYSNMFPRQFPDDMSNSFLAAYFDTFGETRDIVQFLPEFFDEFVEDDDSAILDSFLYILDYVSALEVNSNGQLLNLEESETIEDFDESTLVGSALASSSLYTRLDFLQYTQRHNDLLFEGVDDDRTNTVLAGLFALCALVALPLNQKVKNYNVTFIFIFFVLMTIFFIVKNSLIYYLRLREATKGARPEWYHNLYD